MAAADGGGVRAGRQACAAAAIPGVEAGEGNNEAAR